MVSMSGSPFVLENAGDHLNPNTAVASLELLDSLGTALDVKNLVEPFEIFLERQDEIKNKSFSQGSPTLPTGKVTQSSTIYTSTLTEDSDPDIYIINTTGISSALFVTLLRVSVDNEGQVRVRLRKDDQSQTIGNDLIVSTTSSFPVTLTWRGLQQHATYYVSVEFESLSFRRAGKANGIEYSVSFEELSCHYWNVTHQTWMTKGCQV